MNIIFYILKKNILLPILNNDNYTILTQNEYYNNFITSEFEKSDFNFDPPLKMDINANQITIYNIKIWTN